MTNFVAIFVLVVSFLGMMAIALRKVKVLKNTQPKEFQKKILLKYKQKVRQKARRVKELIEPKLGDLVLEKAISKIKIVAMKIENRCNRLLEAKRARTRERQEKKEYWQKLKQPGGKKKKE